MQYSFFIFGGGNMTRTNRSQQNNAVEVLSYAEQIEELFLDLYTQYDVANAPEKRKSFIVNSFWKDIYKQIFKPDKPQLNNCKSIIKPYDINNIESILDMYISLCDRYNGTVLIDPFCELIGFNRYTVYLWNKNNNSNRYIFTLTDDIIKQENDNIIIYIDNNDEVNILNNNNINDIDSIKLYNNRYKDNMSEKDKLLSSLRFDIVKKIRDVEQTRSKLHLSNSDIGMIFRSNNEDELGLKYDAKRTIEQEQIKQIATAGQLPVFNKLSENDTQFITKNE